MNVTEELYHDSDTMFKVFKALRDVVLTEKESLAAITNMQNSGIYFREAPR